MKIKLIAVFVTFSLLIQSTPPSYAQNASSDIQVKQIKECFSHVLDSETLSPENLARFDLGDGTSPDELSMLKGLTLWSMDMKDYHQRNGGIYLGTILQISYPTIFVTLMLTPLLSESKKLKKFRLSNRILLLVSLAAYGITGWYVDSTKNKYIFTTDITNTYLQSLMHTLSSEEFWEQLAFESQDGSSYRNQIIVGCNNVLSFKKSLDIEPDRVLDDLSTRNHTSDLNPLFQTPNGQSFELDQGIIVQIKQELEKDRIEVPKVNTLLEQAIDTASTNVNNSNSEKPHTKSKIEENPITTCVADIGGIYQVKDLQTQKTSYWKIQSLSGSSESYEIAMNSTNSFSDPEWVTASMGQFLAPSVNVNHCGITYYDDISKPSIFLILKQDSTKIMLGSSPMRTMPRYELIRK